MRKRHSSSANDRFEAGISIIRSKFQPQICPGKNRLRRRSPPPRLRSDCYVNDACGRSQVPLSLCSCSQIKSKGKRSILSPSSSIASAVWWLLCCGGRVCVIVLSDRHYQFYQAGKHRYHLTGTEKKSLKNRLHGLFTYTQPTTSPPHLHNNDIIITSY